MRPPGHRPRRRPDMERAAARVRDGSRIRVSTRLFQPPQPRHWPSQRRNVSPQLWQTYRLCDFAIPDAPSSGGNGGCDCVLRRPSSRRRPESSSRGRVDREAGVRVLVDDDRLARLVRVQQELLGERVLDHVLDHPPQRSGAIRHVVAELDDVVLGLLGDLERQLLCAQLVPHPGEHQVHDLADLVDRQRSEDDRRVDAVQELRPEVLLELLRDLLLHQVVRGGRRGPPRCRPGAGSRATSSSGAASRRGWRS